MNNPDPVLKVTDLKTWFHTDGEPSAPSMGFRLKSAAGDLRPAGRVGLRKVDDGAVADAAGPEPAGRIVSGAVLLEGHDLCTLRKWRCAPCGAVGSR